MKGGNLKHELRYEVWDILTREEFDQNFSVVTYRDRLKRQELLKEPVSLIEHKEVKDLKQAHQFYDRMRADGHEGAVLKNYNSIWKSNTCPTMIKMKHFASAEFVVVGVHEGKDKYKGMLGALEVESKDANIRTKVGSGFTDAERDLTYWSNNIGSIVEIKFESVISDKTREFESLFLPVFIEERTDKTKADTAAYIKKL